MSKAKYIYTIEELYKWAVEKEIEKYTVFGQDEGIPCNIIEQHIVINKEEEVVYIC